MKLIIDIPEETYNHVCDIFNRLTTRDEESQIENAIRNGIPFDSSDIEKIRAEIEGIDPITIMGAEIKQEILDIIDKPIGGKDK